MHPSTQLIRVFLICAVSFAGSIPSVGADDVSDDRANHGLLQKVMSGLPRYGEIPRTAAPPPPDPNAEVEPEVTHLAPLVILGRMKALNLDELALLTEKAREAVLRKRYGSSFEYAEEKRIQEAIRLRDYAKNLRVAGDRVESAAIQKEVDRLLVGRNSDWKMQDIDKRFNPRYR